jgi:ATP-dependent helicase/nuclease subunit B
MAAIEEICLPPGGSVEALWRAAAEAAFDWLGRHEVAVRDAVVLVPFAALLAPARRAFAAAAQARAGGGWLPRIETPLTLAAALGPPSALAVGACCGDARQDRLHAAEQLRSLPALADMAGSDPARFDVIAQRLAETATALRAAALAVPPARRAAHWQAVQAALRMNPGGPAGLEWALLVAAATWAEASASDATDRMFALRPGAWIGVRIAGAQALTEGVLAASSSPALRLVADAADDDPFAAARLPPQLRRVACEDAEQEAQAAAAAVIAALDAGREPVALVALDRALVRRVRALLERRSVDLVDETGWRLATTVAGTRVAGLLRAAHAGADADTRLAWLKSWPRTDEEGLASLEARWRERRHVPSPAAADRLEQAASRHLAVLRGDGPAPLGQWLQRLRESLATGGEMARLLADAAGRQVIDALWLGDEGPPPAVADAAARWQADLAAFTAWVESALQASPFLPELPEEAPAPRVVLTPLARAVGRPFAHVVLPAADETHLGPPAGPPALVPAALAQTFGCDPPAATRLKQRQALAQLLRADALTVLRRCSDVGAPLAPSPDLEWLWLRLAAAETARSRDAGGNAGSNAGGNAAPDVARAVPAEQPWAPPHRQAPAIPVARPAPSVPASALPAVLSASRIEALRECPYRFFALGVLGLEEAAELAEPLSRRDYGQWLHELLHGFHRRRAKAEGPALDGPGEGPGEGQRVPALHALDRPPAAETQAARDARWLHEAAAEAAAKLGLDAAELLPFQASFASFAPAYLRWLAEREAAGWRWVEGESLIEVAPTELAPTGLRGIIDRLDRGPGGRLAVLDYKAGALERQRKRVSDPLEDTQLCVYAVLVQASGRAATAALEAAYVALDETAGATLVPHRGVELSAPQMLQRFAAEWQRVRAGAPLPALGEPPACDICEARGLCRRDQWSQGSPEPQGSAAAGEADAAGTSPAAEVGRGAPARRAAWSTRR